MDPDAIVAASASASGVERDPGDRQASRSPSNASGPTKARTHAERDVALGYATPAPDPQAEREQRAEHDLEAPRRDEDGDEARPSRCRPLAAVESRSRAASASSDHSGNPSILHDDADQDDTRRTRHAGAGRALVDGRRGGPRASACRRARRSGCRAGCSPRGSPRRAGRSARRGPPRGARDRLDLDVGQSRRSPSGRRTRTPDLAEPEVRVGPRPAAVQPEREHRERADGDEPPGRRQPRARGRRPGPRSRSERRAPAPTRRRDAGRRQPRRPEPREVDAADRVW